MPHCLPHGQVQRQAECHATPCRCGAGLDSIARKSGNAWRLADGIIALEVVVPPGASAEIHLSDGQVEQVASGTHRLS